MSATILLVYHFGVIGFLALLTPLLKLILLASIKLIVLGIGALVAPVRTVSIIQHVAGAIVERFVRFLLFWNYIGNDEINSFTAAYRPVDMVLADNCKTLKKRGCQKVPLPANRRLDN
ncbi:MAG: hypothetical protein H6782_03730 [Candidatus Nomurabacteria bacterium]|nr:MAG: hypothetical protein H6782_03730 [Candidatus Nomurabacteria bacterium]